MIAKTFSFTNSTKNILLLVHKNIFNNKNTEVFIDERNQLAIISAFFPSFITKSFVIW